MGVSLTLWACLPAAEGEGGAAERTSDQRTGCGAIAEETGAEEGETTDTHSLLG